MRSLTLLLCCLLLILPAQAQDALPTPLPEPAAGPTWLIPITPDNMAQLDRLHSLNLESPFADFAIKPDGSQVTFARDYRTLEVWDVASNTFTALPNPDDSVVNSFKYTPDGTRLIVDGGGPYTIWNMTTGEQIAELPSHEGAGVALEISPDGRFLATTDGGVSGGTGNVFLWNAVTGEALAELRDEALMEQRETTPYVTGVDFSPDSRHLVATAENNVFLWNLEDFTLERRIPLDQNANKFAQRAYFIDDGQQLLVTSDERLEVYTIDGTLSYTRDDTDPEWYELVSADRRWLIQSFEEQFITRIIALQPLPQDYMVLPFRSRHMALSPDGLLLASGSNIGNIYLTALTLPVARSSLRLWSPDVAMSYDVAFSPDMRYLLSSLRLVERDGDILSRLDIWGIPAD